MSRGNATPATTRPLSTSELVLDALAQIQQVTHQHADVVHDLRHIMRRPPARMDRERLTATEPLKEVDIGHQVKSVGVLNFSGSTVQIGIAGRSAQAGNGLPLPPHTFLVLPLETNIIDLGADPNELTANGPADVMVLLFDSVQELAAGALPLVAGANVVDVADRAGRLLGHVTVDALPAGGVDVTDRAGRLLGVVSAAVGALWDVSDRAGRALGLVGPAAGSTWDVSDRAARLLGVADVSDRAARLLGVTDVSDRAARLLGIVDKARPATSAVTNVVSSAVNVTLLAANAARKGATIFNDSTQVCFVKLGVGASSVSYTVQIAAGGYYEVPFDYTGQIDALWAAANGNARVTELTP